MNCICKKKGCKKCNPMKTMSVKAKTTTTQIVRRRKGGTGGEYDKKVLIVVDVQNCFLNEGSYGGLRDLNTVLKQIIIVSNVIKKIKEDNGYDLIVFSRDAHTEKHISYVVHPIHCRKGMRVNLSGAKSIRQLINELRKDNDTSPVFTEVKKEFVKLMYPGRIVGTKELDRYIDDHLDKKIEDSKTIGDISIIGSDLSYLFLLCGDDQLLEFFYKAYNDMKFKFSKADLRIKYDDEIQDKLIKNEIFFNYEGKKLVVMDKGEYDNAESYSSFNYHYLKKPELAKLSNEQINTKMANEGITQENVPAREQYVYDELPRELKYSTGLTEIIKHGLPANTRMLLDVCGFVTEICVKQTGVNGYYYLNFINNNNNLKVDVNIDYSLSSTLFGTPFNVYEKQISDIQSELMPKIRAIESIKSKSLRAKMSQMSAPQRAMSAMSAGRKQMRPKK
jgi:nicotinamidase-related amidase